MAGILVLLGLAVWLVLRTAAPPVSSTDASPDVTPVASPVATRDVSQIERGATVYATTCAVCHGASLDGGAGPKLTDPGLHNRFATALDLYQYVKTSMPPGDDGPGSLSDAEYLAVVAFMLDARDVTYADAIAPATAAEVSLAPVAAASPPAETPDAPAARAAPQLPAPASSGNSPPFAPTLTEPAPVLLAREQPPFVMTLQTAPFADTDSEDWHTATEFEIREFHSGIRVWSSQVKSWPLDETVLERGVFEGPLAGRMSLNHKTVYAIRARHRDSSADPGSEWSAWSAPRVLLTAQQGLPTPNPMRLRDIQHDTLQWEADDGTPVILQDGSTLLITGSASPHLEIAGDGGRHTVRDFSRAAHFESTYFKFVAGPDGLEVPASRISFRDSAGVRRTVWMPFMKLDPERFLIAASTAEGGFYFEPDVTELGNARIEPLLITRVRSPEVPWRVADGFRVELVADGLVLPVQIAPNPRSIDDPAAPVAYITELYGSVRALGADGVHWLYAADVLDERPSEPPARLSGQTGTSGVAVDPLTGDVFVSTTYRGEGGDLHNKIVRLESDDDGRTAVRAVDVLRMDGEDTGPSHQIHGLLFGHDGHLYAAVGNGMHKWRGLDDKFFGGKLLRLNRDGSAPADNPHFDPTQPDAPISYQWAKGLRNDFALAQRPGDEAIYTAENGPAIDRLLRLEAGRNYGYAATDASIVRQGLWFFGPPAVTPVGIAFAIGGAFPAERQGNFYVGTHGFNFVEGTVDNGKRIWEFELDADGDVARPPSVFLTYVGDGFANITGVAYLADGLYFLDFYNDHPPEGEPTAPGARLWRIVPDTE
ncbi:MAG: PQQ-dependent sugar dehydrogenase [Chloroflexi bacterium]|nr:PQQ-dependent sugar dehydrogenase [Chloroflexota bacterium]